LRDPALQAGIINLCQNRIIHRIPEPSEAVRLMQQMLTIYINNITLTEEAQNLERFMADDIMRLPDHTAICLWQAKGAVQSPFVAQTIDWRPDAHEEWATWHKDHQPGWLPPEEPETFELTEDKTDQTDSTAGDMPRTEIVGSVADDALPSLTYTPPPVTPHQSTTEWGIEALADRFQLSTLLINKLCRSHGCTLNELAQVLMDHDAERPAFMIQVSSWLDEHPEWFPHYPPTEDVPNKTAAAPSAEHGNNAPPWLLK
jgi:hypothetical protein